MTERLLQFIWQMRYFNRNALVTTCGEALQIIYPGIFNTNQGPDFSEAKIKIGDTTWIGHIEIHIKSSDWNKHGHQDDKNYNSVILHVVWEDDVAKKVPAGSTTGKGKYNSLPVLELKDKVSKLLLSRYESLMNSSTFIACQDSVHIAPDITWKAWKERLLAERLINKSAFIETALKQNNYHWEEIFWWLLARNFGIKVNAEAFEQIARSIPLHVLSKHKHQIHQLEALLLGQAGLLKGNFKEDYPRLLQKEYKFLAVKWRLEPVANTIFFLRMRPEHFPTIRLAQLAMLVHQSSQLFSCIREAHSVNEVKELFQITANDYWHYHYIPDEISCFKKKKPGTRMIDNIIINTVIPLLFTYGIQYQDSRYKNKAMNWLENITAEDNSITRGFGKLGVENKNALDSQALIHLKNDYCDKKRCLDCSIGNAILKT